MLVRWESKGCCENTQIGCYTHSPPDRDVHTFYYSLKSRQGCYAGKPIEIVWSTFINMKPVWFDLEQLLYLKRKNYGEGLSRVELSPLSELALVRA